MEAVLESHMRKLVIAMLRPLHAVPVENGEVCPGTPDVNYAGGNIELKAVDNWPVRGTTALRIPHYSPQQRIWHMQRAAAGGRVHLLLSVGRDWLLFDGTSAAAHLGNDEGTRQYLLDMAVHVWHRHPTPEELIRCLRRPT